MKRALEQIKKHEGFSRYPYSTDTKELYIGYGRKLDSYGVTQDEAEMLLANDLSLLQNMIQISIDTKSCNSPRLASLVTLSYNLGFDGLMNFKHTLKCAEKATFSSVSDELLQSHWARKKPIRAVELILQLESGEWQ
ncbi:hypothetical protein CJF42_22475 [Pseudoalteromonas sp. NBT06-2]|uniref:glycoside hydrolase family protein n=1 Tax=Pseudoalteromonas sp. NBT06-2 TaxID=2025950 RepID=UPI000BA7C38C|nr:glycoside hydrolase [Pseudoalteromonas sp. NBT06-2]PAJ72217.1 hypothetical protein CJF42_22475 [Pseudoalteromonas sp. NBT06-2]